MRETKEILDLSFQPFRSSTVFSFRSIVGPNFSTPQRKLHLVAFSSLRDTRVYPRGRRRRRRHPTGMAGPLYSCLLPSGCLRGARSTQGGPLACEGSGEESSEQEGRAVHLSTRARAIPRSNAAFGYDGTLYPLVVTWIWSPAVTLRAGAL